MSLIATLLTKSCAAGAVWDGVAPDVDGCEGAMRGVCAKAPDAASAQAAAFAARAGCRQGRLSFARSRSGRAKFSAAFIGAEVAATAAAGPIKHGKLRVEALQHDLGRIFVLTRLVLPFARLQRAFEVD